jgi:hypothetical protein
LEHFGLINFSNPLETVYKFLYPLTNPLLRGLLFINGAGAAELVNEHPVNTVVFPKRLGHDREPTETIWLYELTVGDTWLNRRRNSMTLNHLFDDESTLVVHLGGEQKV